MFLYVCQTNSGWAWQCFGHVIDFGNHNGWKRQQHYPGFILFKNIMLRSSGDRINLKPPSASTTLTANDSSAASSSSLGVSIAESYPQAQHNGRSSDRLRPTVESRGVQPFNMVRVLQGLRFVVQHALDPERDRSRSRSRSRPGMRYHSHPDLA